MPVMLNRTGYACTVGCLLTSAFVSQHEGQQITCSAGQFVLSPPWLHMPWLLSAHPEMPLLQGECVGAMHCKTTPLQLIPPWQDLLAVQQCPGTGLPTDQAQLNDLQAFLTKR